MLERETEIIIGILTEKTIGARESITLGEVLAADIPAGVKTFIQREVHRTLGGDLRAARHFARVNTQSPSVSHLLKSVLDGFSVEYAFPRTEFLSTLDSAVNFQENYLCRPQWTLLNFMFDGVDYLPHSVLMEKFGYFLDYTYFPQLVDRIMRKRQWTGISKEAFQILLRRIDDSLVLHTPPRDIALLTKPIFDFLFLESVAIDDMTKAVPVKPLMVFLGEKGMNDVVKRMEWLAKEGSKEHCALPELIDLITEVQSAGPEPIPEPPAGDDTANPLDTTPPAVELTADEVTSEPWVFDLHPEHEGTESVFPPSTEPLTQENPAGATEAGDEPVPAEPPAITGEHSHVSDVKRQNVALSLTFAGLEKEETSQLPDLHSLIPPDRRQDFIRSIFRDDDAYFNGIIRGLNKAPTWQEAARFLKDFYESNEIDPFAEETIEFTDTIHRRYQPPSRDPS